MHRLLQRQIKKLFGDVQGIPSTLVPLFEAISATYEQADKDRIMIERSLDIVSQEMLEKNHLLIQELKIRQAAELKLEHLTNFDTLTGLVNRNLFSDRLKQAIINAHRHKQNIAILMLGLDHFKMINDNLGLDFGNELLKTISDRLIGCVRGSDTVARLGGDEFALILVEQNQENSSHYLSMSTSDAPYVNTCLIEILQRILKKVSDVVVFADREMQVTCSIGVSLYPQDGDNIDELLQHAGAALASAKQIGRNNFQFYTSELSLKIAERFTIQAELRLALEREEFILHYQPQVDLYTGAIIGVETLIRWNHPQKGMIPPGRFIGLAEETGLIVPIGAWVIRTACMQAREWQQAGYGRFRIAVNLSVRQFMQPDLVQFIAAVLAETGLDPSLLEIELTESLVMSDAERATNILHGIKGLGVQLSVDDFGTGYSSLSYLKRFPIDALKIDQSFVQDVETADGAAIANAIISMAHSLGIKVIAEGVETEAQCDFLRLNRCDEIQGFFFSKGLPKNEIESLFKQNRRLPDHLLLRLD